MSYGFMGGNYFSHKREYSTKAKKHMREMEIEYNEEIDTSVTRSAIYGPEMPAMSDVDGDLVGPTFYLVNSTHSKFIHDVDLADDIVCVHNFASYKNPGGMFLRGSSAQEESLCHQSTLYNVLSRIPAFYEWNIEHKNKGLYTDRAIYSPDIMFRFDEGSFYTSVNVDVLTCAAPNASLMKKYGAFTMDENKASLERRVSFISRILDQQNVHTFITGAWGCGVFEQDPTEVAMLMHMYLQRTNLKKVYFVIPRGRNYTAFQKALVRDLVVLS